MNNELAINLMVIDLGIIGFEWEEITSILLSNDFNDVWQFAINNIIRG